MAHFYFLNLKTSNLSRFESMWFLSSIVLLISSVMCLAVAGMALILPGVNAIFLWLAIASLSCGLVGYASIKRLQRRQNSGQCYT